MAYWAENAGSNPMLPLRILSNLVYLFDGYFCINSLRALNETWPSSSKRSPGVVLLNTSSKE